MYRKIIKFIISVLGSLIRTEDSPAIKEEQRKLKSLFQTYFEGCYSQPPICETPLLISSMMITDINFAYSKNSSGMRVVTMIITLGRPGVLIGKAGKVINGLKNWLSDENTIVDIHIVESKLWTS